MSKPLSPEEPAPSYDELFSGHPTAAAQPQRFGASRVYAAVSQDDSDGDDDTVELVGNSGRNNARRVHDEESHPHSTAPVADPTKPHHHCEVCDRQLERREKKRNEARCCRMVALTFIVAFICATVLGIAIARANSH